MAELCEGWGFVTKRYASQTDKELFAMISNIGYEKSKYDESKFVRFFAEHPDANANAVVEMAFKKPATDFVMKATVLQIATAYQLSKLIDFLTGKGAILINNPNPDLQWAV